MLRPTAVLAGLLFVVAPLSAPAQDAPLRMELVYQGEDQPIPDIRLVTPSDGYLLLLHVIGGTARVMFPVKPGSSAALASGEYNLSRLGTKMPFAQGRPAGIVVAAWSKTPIRTGEFVRHGHWAVSDLSRDAFTYDPAGATIDLATKLGATPGMAVAVEYGSVAEYREESDDLAIRNYRSDGRDNQEWLVVQNLIRITGNCPAGTRDVTGAGEACYSPPSPPRERALRPVTGMPTSQPVERPGRPLHSPPAANPPPAAAPPRPATPPPSGGSGKKPL